MSIRNRIAIGLAAALLAGVTVSVALAALSLSPQVGGGIGGFDGGINSSGVAPSPPPACVSALVFTAACNSQYIGVL